MSYWVQVVVATPAHSAIAGPLTYRSKLPLSAGTLVRVPLGKREVMGVVWDMAPTLVASRTALPPEGVELRLGRPGASFVAPTLVASHTAQPPMRVELRLGRPGKAGSPAPAGVESKPPRLSLRVRLDISQEASHG